jgi:hypothetical protein
MGTFRDRVSHYRSRFAQNTQIFKPQSAPRMRSCLYVFLCELRVLGGEYLVLQELIITIGEWQFQIHQG